MGNFYLFDLEFMCYAFIIKQNLFWTENIQYFHFKKNSTCTNVVIQFSIQLRVSSVQAAQMTEDHCFITVTAVNDEIIRKKKW